MKNKNVITGLLFVVSVLFLMNLVAADVVSVTSVTPVTNTWTNDTTPSFVFWVEGNETIYNCTLYLNGTQKAQNTSVKNVTNTTLTSTTLTDGAYSWKVSCTNGTEGNSTARVLNLDSTAPTVTLTRKPTTSTIEYLTYINATCSATDATSSTLTYLITLTSPSGATTTSTATSYKFSGSNLKTLGTYTLDCAVTDQGSNVGSATQLKFRVEEDTTAEEAVAAGIIDSGFIEDNKNTLLIIGVVVILLIIIIATTSSKKKK